MDALDFLQFEPDFSSPRVIAAYDELPLWSAMFGLLLLDEVPLTRVKVALAFSELVLESEAALTRRHPGAVDTCRGSTGSVLCNAGG